MIMPVNTANLSSKIKGWGVDLDTARRPGIPRERAPVKGTGVHWVVPPQQESNVKIYVTIEKAGITPVFGTTCPPIGISGKLRDYAYTLEAAKLARWITLLLADRVNMVEGIFMDL